MRPDIWVFMYIYGRMLCTVCTTLARKSIRYCEYSSSEHRQGIACRIYPLFRITIGTSFTMHDTSITLQWNNYPHVPEQGQNLKRKLSPLKVASAACEQGPMGYIA